MRGDLRHLPKKRYISIPNKRAKHLKTDLRTSHKELKEECKTQRSNVGVNQFDFIKKGTLHSPYD